MLPTTTPVQFDPDAFHATIDRLMSYRPRRIYQTHFGPVDDRSNASRATCTRPSSSSCGSPALHAAAPDRRRRIEEDMFRYFDARLDEHGYAGDLATRHALIDDDVRLNTAGLEVWLDRWPRLWRQLQPMVPLALAIAYRLSPIAFAMPSPSAPSESTATTAASSRASTRSRSTTSRPGDVVVRVRYSDINYKDALAATGKGRSCASTRWSGGIDLAGEVVSSTDPRYAPGQQVLVTGCGLSETQRRRLRRIRPGAGRLGDSAAAPA